MGRVVQKGKATFVVPDLPNLSRWLFIPPHARNGITAGDLVACALLRHPFQDGKPSAKVLKHLGTAETPGIENQYCAARAGLPAEWSDKSAQPLVQAAAQQTPLQDTSRLDLTDLPFVSIDGARTVDIDDAVHAEVTQQGWQLSVAVADPTAYLERNERTSAVARRERGLRLLSRRRNTDAAGSDWTSTVRTSRGCGATCIGLSDADRGDR